MNTATWASMEADSGGAVPGEETLEWTHIVYSAMYYSMRSSGYDDAIARQYAPSFAILEINALGRAIMQRNAR